MVHRLGRILIGETSVVVIVTAPHRRAAFEAALDGINRLKSLVPVWKKEHLPMARGLGGRRMGPGCSGRRLNPRPGPRMQVP